MRPHAGLPDCDVPVSRRSVLAGSVATSTLAVAAPVVAFGAATEDDERSTRLKHTCAFGQRALLLFFGEALGGAQGMVVGFFFAVVMNFASYWFSDKIVLRMYGAQEVGAGHRLYESVRRLAERALFYSPAHPGFAAHALHLLGDVAAHLDRPHAERDEAEAHYRKALALADGCGMRPLVAHCYLGLGRLARRQLDLQRHAGEHRRAVELQPGNAAYLNNLGFSLFLRGKHHDAVKYYSEAARLTPTNRRLRTNLGFALAALACFLVIRRPG